VVCSVLGPVSLAFGWAQPNMQPSRFWGAALVAVAGGLALIGLQGFGPDFVSQVLGPGLLALALIWAGLCARSTLGKSVRDIFGWSFLAAFVLALAALERAAADGSLRHLFGMALTGFLAFRAAHGFDRGREPRERRALRLIALVLDMVGIGLVLEAALAASAPGDAVEPGVIRALMLVGLIACLLLGTILLLWLMTERINHRIHKLVTVDPLTGVLNRPTFIKSVESEVSRTQRRTYAPFALLLLDIDRFRRINDAYGHQAGDRLLERIAEILRGSVREYDVIGRLEGDVFVLLLPGTPGEGAVSMAKRVRHEIERKASALAELRNPVSATIGVAVFGEHGDNWDTMLRAADWAARKAKAEGGNQVEVAVPVAPSSAATPDADAIQPATPD